MDESTFEQTVNSYYEPLYRFALSLTRQEADACDLTQETFRRLADKGHQLRDQSKVKTWLFSTLYRVFVNTWRWESRFPHLEIGAVEQELPPTPSSVADRIDSATARDALERLDEIYRAPLALFYLEEHSYREIAEILDIPTGTVMSRISRGKALLRQMLADRRQPHASNVIVLEPPKASVAS